MVSSILPSMMSRRGQFIFVKLKEGTRVVILHSVLAPADTCSMCGVRLKFEFWQLGFQGFESQPLAL
jgi:hypothetical protein